MYEQQRIQDKLNRVRNRELRMICTKRKVYLRKRGESAWWDRDLDSWVWEPKQ